MTARKTSLSNSFGRALLSPYAATFILSRRSLQRVQEKVRLQLEYPPVFRAPVAGGVIFLTGDDTAMNGFTFALGLLLEYYHTQILGYKISMSIEAFDYSSNMLFNDTWTESSNAIMSPTKFE